MKMDKINQNIIDIWDKYNVSERVPLLYPDLKTETILFVGLNPSFSLKGFKKILKDTEYEKELDSLDEFYSYRDFKKDKIKDYQNIEKYSREKHPYFKRFHEISIFLNTGWEHVDLLLIRNTNQKDIEKLIKLHKDFINEQICLVIELIKMLNPKTVVIENAFASKLIQDKLKLDFNNNYGTYLIDKKIPVFYSGMLTGGRALDLGSLERLKWHIKYCIEKCKK
ncbi:MAG: hypothetical protein JXA16_14185 [Bacteroidales bacterium]|nr:hypothetical protein [Bacteroidales bacterium]